MVPFISKDSDRQESMHMLESVVIIAPGHDELDHRVLRSFDLISKVSLGTTLFFEASRVTKNFKDDSRKKIYSPISILDLFLLRRKVLNYSIFKKIKAADLLYIHDSGLYGVLFVRLVNYFFPEKKVVFDYHDFLDWEVLHHISKYVTQTSLKIMCFSVIMLWLNKFVISSLRLYALVGISEGQIKRLSMLLKHPVQNKLTIPNTRPYLNENFEFLENSGICNFIWIGNVGANRSVEIINKYATMFEEKCPHVTVEFSVIGKVWGSGESLLRNASFLGGYKTDKDILLMLPHKKNIGIFFGWEDPFELGINAVGSPNKVYSYINLGLPFLIPSSLNCLIESCSIPTCFVFNCEVDFLAKVESIVLNYRYFCQEARNLKGGIRWDENIRTEITDVFRSMLD